MRHRIRQHHIMQFLGIVIDVSCPCSRSLKVFQIVAGKDGHHNFHGAAGFQVPGILGGVGKTMHITVEREQEAGVVGFHLLIFHYRGLFRTQGGILGRIRIPSRKQPVFLVRGQPGGVVEGQRIIVVWPVSHFPVPAGEFKILGIGCANARTHHAGGQAAVAIRVVGISEFIAFTFDVSGFVIRGFFRSHGLGATVAVHIYAHGAVVQRVRVHVGDVEFHINEVLDVFIAPLVAHLTHPDPDRDMGASTAGTAKVPVAWCAKGAVVIIVGYKILFRNRRAVLVDQAISVVVIRIREVVSDVAFVREVHKAQGIPQFGIVAGSNGFVVKQAGFVDKLTSELFKHIWQAFIAQSESVTNEILVDNSIAVVILTTLLMAYTGSCNSIGIVV